MAQITITTAGSEDQLREVAQKVADELAGTRGLQVSLRFGGDINPQTENIRPSEDVEEEGGFLPGQIPNSPLEGPGYGSGESYWSLDTTIPEPNKEQKARMKELEKASKQKSKDSRQNGEELRKQMEEQAKEQQKEAREAIEESISRGVVPMGPRDAEPDPDFRVEIVEGEEGSK